MAKALTHLAAGGEAHMVDVSEKPETERVAVAEGRVIMAPATLDIVLKGDAKKGDVLGAARIAGIMAAKRTHELIPLCHPLPVSKIAVEIAADRKLPGLTVRATAQVAVDRYDFGLTAYRGLAARALTVEFAVIAHREQS